MSKPYQLTLADLRHSCPLLKSIEVAGKDSKSEQLVGRNGLGEVVVRTKGKVSPASVMKFRNEYQRAVSAGIIKPPVEEEPNA
jgi:hypothetical protein